jgi:hypothetical protein
MPFPRSLRSQPHPHEMHILWTTLVVAVSLLWACNNQKLVAPIGRPALVKSKVFAEKLNRDLDIVFMVDDSPSMKVLQDKLADQFPIFMQVLQGLPNGLPNVHIAVVTQDLGAGAVDLETSGCPIGGDQGQFRFTVGPNGKVKGADGMLKACTATGLMQGESFISDVAGPDNVRIKNYTGAITDVFGCIAGTGDKGCGFEAQLASVARALGADGQGPPPVANAGFLRPDAFLAIVLITNEDDGSVPPDSLLYAVDDLHLAPFDNFRGQEYGILCDGAAPPLTMAVGWSSGHCHSNPNGGLVPVQALIDQIRSVKKDPSQVLVAAIAGLPDPYATHLEPVPTSGGTIQSAFVNHACMAADASYGDPGIRLFEFVSAFDGFYESICAPTFAPALRQIAGAIGKQIGPPCIKGPFEDRDAITPGAQADCQVTERRTQLVDRATGAEAVIPSCDGPHHGRCWSLVADSTRCPGADEMVLELTPPPDPTVSSLDLAISCAICPPSVVDPRCE